MRRALVMLALLSTVGCGKSRTEAVVVVTTQGVRIPDDVDAVHVQITDAQNPTPPLWDASYTICNSVISSNCVTLPFTMTLIPGDGKPSDSTRVFIAAQRSGVDRIDDAAVFTFSRGQSLRLDFVLYADCLDMLNCAVMNQACGPNRMCMPVQANPFSGEPDLAAGRVQDLSAAPHDLAGADLLMSHVGDLAHPPPPDMASFDLANCSHACLPNQCMSECGDTCTCPMGSQCNGVSSTCEACGGRNQSCCRMAADLGGVGGCDAQLTCNGVNCVCGGLGQPCCLPGNTCNVGLMCGPGIGGVPTCETMSVGLDM